MSDLQPVDYKMLQTQVFNRLAMIYQGDDLVFELGSLLNLQKAAVYKRMNGDTLIKFDELVNIAIHFNFSLESVFNAKKEHISFQFDLIDDEVDTYKDIFVYIQKVFDTFKSSEGNVLIYSSKNLPFMHYMNYPALFELHMHMWKNTSFRHGDQSKFSQSSIRKFDDKEIEMLSALAKEYYDHPAIEIWGPNILDDIYSQVKFFVLSNTIHDISFINDICSNLQLLINHLKIITKRGVKEQPGRSDNMGTMKVYINELELGTPMLYYESDKETKCFLIHHAPNFISTYQSSFCGYTQNLLSNVMSYSTVISKEGTKDRIKFFNKIQSRFDKFKEDIYKVFEYSQL